MKIIAIVEKSNGNESVGDMWKETASFDENTPVIEIIRWAVGGKYHDPTRLNNNLIITIDQSSLQEQADD